jgi:hypothetical protein
MTKKLINKILKNGGKNEKKNEKKRISIVILKPLTAIR